MSRNFFASCSFQQGFIRSVFLMGSLIVLGPVRASWYIDICPGAQKSLGLAARQGPYATRQQAQQVIDAQQASTPGDICVTLEAGGSDDTGTSAPSNGNNNGMALPPMNPSVGTVQQHIGYGLMNGILTGLLNSGPSPQQKAAQAQAEEQQEEQEQLEAQKRQQKLDAEKQDLLGGLKDSSSDGDGQKVTDTSDDSLGLKDIGTSDDTKETQNRKKSTEATPVPTPVKGVPCPSDWF